MSKFSGQCDFYDELGFLVERNPDGSLYSGKVEDYKGALYSSEIECFYKFMELTDGKLYQHIPVKPTKENIKNLAKIIPDLKIISHRKDVPDKRKKTGIRTVTTYTYQYYKTEYKTVEEMQKDRNYLYIEQEIPIETLVDLIPYYPYINSHWVYNDDRTKCKVYISRTNGVERDNQERLSLGFKPATFFQSILQQHYIEIIQKYYNADGTMKKIKYLNDKMDFKIV